MLTLKKVKELVGAPSHAKRTPSPKMLYEEGIVLLRREFDQGSHLTVYNSGYVLFSAGKRNTVFHMEYPYFKGLEADRYSFYRVPKALVKADLFQKMSGDAKLLYAVLLDRMGNRPTGRRRTK